VSYDTEEDKDPAAAAAAAAGSDRSRAAAGTAVDLFGDEADAEDLHAVDVVGVREHDAEEVRVPCGGPLPACVCV
jgi:hypothetical protein